jgi:hypothetical protein
MLHLYLFTPAENIPDEGEIMVLVVKSSQAENARSAAYHGYCNNEELKNRLNQFGLYNSARYSKSFREAFLSSACWNVQEIPGISVPTGDGSEILNAIFVGE